MQLFMMTEDDEPITYSSVKKDNNVRYLPIACEDYRRYDSIVSSSKLKGEKLIFILIVFLSREIFQSFNKIVEYFSVKSIIMNADEEKEKKRKSSLWEDGAEQGCDGRHGYPVLFHPGYLHGEEYNFFLFFFYFVFVLTGNNAQS